MASGIRRLPLAVLIYGLAATGSAAHGEPTLARFEQSQPHMGTVFRLVFYAPDERSASKAADAAFARIAELNAMMSDYSDTSELTRLSQSAGGPPRPVSEELFGILDRSQDFARQSDGAFDITVGPAVRLWRRARRQRKLPTEQQIRDALGRVGHDKLVLDKTNRTAQLKTPGMILDLGGIAKGYACDEALEVFKRHGIDRAFIDGGGGISVSEPPPGKEGWTIELPAVKGAPTASPTLTLRNQSVATSGDTEQFVEVDNQRYSHIVDPKTGLGLTTHLRVTVIAPQGATADALATAVSVLGPEKGLKLIEATPGAAALIVRPTETKVETLRSGNWTK